MCEVCKLEGVDWKFRNGAGRSLSRCLFFRVYEGEAKLVHLCLICSIDLFHIGETRFLSRHPLLAIEFSKNQSSSVEDDFSFNFA